MIPYGKQDISREDIEAVKRVLCSSFLTQGPEVERFEDAIRDYTGAKYCVAVANGTAALHIAVAALNLPQNSEGITSPITFTASSNSMIYCGVKPVFADIDATTYCLDPEQVKTKINANTRLVTPVHFAGRACDMAEIKKIANKNGLKIIEDAAHAIGSEYPDGAKVGSCKYSDLTIFSFHPVKTVTSGEGGAVTTNDEQLYKSLLSLRSHGISKDPDVLDKNPGPWYYEMHDLGFNYRITDIQSALGASQLKRLEYFRARRLEIVKMYNSAFRNQQDLTIPCENNEDETCFHLYVLKVDFDKIKITRAEVMSALKTKGIGSQVHYIPVHLQPYYRDNYKYKPGDYPVAENYYNHTLSLPLYPSMSDDNVRQVIEAVKDVCRL